MSRLFSLVLERWPAFALAASALMLAAAHTFERLGYPPCLLCYRQREAYWTAAALALAGLAVTALVKRRGYRTAVNFGLALVFLVGAGVAAYHAGVEWRWWPGPAACAAGVAGVSAEDMSLLLGEGQGPIAAPSCEDPTWVFAGLSMAVWNGLISLGLAALSVVAGLRAWRRP